MGYLRGACADSRSSSPVHVARRSQVTQVTPDVLNKFLEKIDSSDDSIQWTFKRRKFEAFGRAKLQDMPAEWFETFLNEVESGSIEQIEFAGPDLVNRVNKNVRGNSNRAKFDSWRSLMKLENGGIGRQDPRRLPQEFVE